MILKIFVWFQLMVIFQIKERLMKGQPDLDYFPFKFKALGIQYLIALLIQTSENAFLVGLYLSGQYNNLYILRNCGILNELELRKK